MWGTGEKASGSHSQLTNDYDEAVINANWGLGESVVAGLVSPDHFIVDKVSRQVVEKKLGAKQVSIWLGPDGGTIERTGARDTPKHQIVLFNYALRKRVLIEGKRLVREGRLDAAGDVFDLTIRLLS